MMIMATTEKEGMIGPIKTGIIFLLGGVILYFILTTSDYFRCASFCNKAESAFPGFWSRPGGCHSMCRFVRWGEFGRMLLFVIVPLSILAMYFRSQYLKSKARKSKRSQTSV